MRKAQEQKTQQEGTVLDLPTKEGDETDRKDTEKQFLERHPLAQDSSRKYLLNY